MDIDLAFAAAAAALLVAGAGGVAWSRQRRRLADLELRLRDAEDSRLELSEDAAMLRQRLQAADQALAARPATAPDLDERRAALERLLDVEPLTLHGGWQDTQPMTLPTGGASFAPTQPAALDTVTDARL